MALLRIVQLPQALILLASSALCVALIECAFRVVPVTYPELSTDTIVAGQKVATDQARIRSQISSMADRAFRTIFVQPEVFENDRTRVLFLGDSFTQGGGLKDPEDRFSNVLERRFNDEFQQVDSLQRLDIFNAGVGGSNPLSWVRYFKRIAPVYKPDVVYAIFFLRDGTPLPTSLRMNRATIDPIRAKYRDMPGYGWSAIGRFLYNKLAWQEYSKEFKRQLTSAYVGTKAETATWRERRRALSVIARSCERLKIPFHLVIFPMLLNLDDYEFFDIEQEITRFARSEGIDVFSLTPGFLGKVDRSLWVAPTDQHPNVEGHLIAAETLYPHLGDEISRLWKAAGR